MFKNHKSFYWVLLTGVFILGILVRTVRLDSVPIELFGDEVDAGYQAYSLLKTGHDYKGNFLPLYIQSFSEWRAPILMYSMVPFVGIFGLNEWGVRMTAAFWGVLSLLGFYLLLRELKVAPQVNLISILLLTVLPWHIQYSRAGYELTLLSSEVIFGALFLIRALKTKKILPAILSATIFGMTFYTYSTANIFTPLLVIGLVIIFLQNKWSGSVNRRVLCSLFGVIFILVSPLVVSVLFGHAADRFQKFSVFNDQTIVDQINRYRSVDGENKYLGIFFQNKPVYFVKRIVSNYLNAFSPDFLFGHGDVTFRQSLHEVGGFFWTEAFLILTGLIVTIRKKRPEDSEKVMFLWILIAPIPASLTIDGASHASRLFYMIFPLIYFGAVGAVYLIESARKIGKVLVIILSLTLMLEFLNFQHYYWVHYQAQSWRWWQDGYKEAIHSIRALTLDGKYQKVVIENTYEPSYIRYLFWTKTDPRLMFGVSDEMKPGEVDGLSGFCLPEQIECFVDFQGTPPQSVVKKGTLYMISQDRNVPGDWDWEKSGPKNVNVIKTIRNPYGYPIFYLITAR